MASTALKSIAEHSTILEAFSFKNTIGKQFVAANDDFKKHSEKASKLLLTDDGFISHYKLGAIVLFVLVAHVLSVGGFIKSLTQPSLVKKEKHEVIIEFVKPAVIPLPVITPPEPLPPPPKVKRETPPPLPSPKPAALKTAPAEENIAPSDMTVKENTEAVKTSGPVVADADAPAPVKDEPITEAIGYAGYLKNPPPEFPAFAQRQGWEGKVILRVRVLASGAPSEIQIKKSSGRKILDEAAQDAVRGWMFAPSKKGDTPIDGWATVPIEFKQPK